MDDEKKADQTKVQEHPDAEPKVPKVIFAGFQRMLSFKSHGYTIVPIPDPVPVPSADPSETTPARESPGEGAGFG